MTTDVASLLAWRDDAACRTKPVSMFFPESGPLSDDNRQALALCTTCPVRERCLEYAIDHREPGIWGGTLETERRRLRRFRMRPNEMWRHGWIYEDQRGWNKKK